MVLTKMKKETAEAFGLHCNAVIFVPAYFNDSQPGHQDAVLSGLNVLRVSMNPLLLPLPLWLR